MVPEHLVRKGHCARGQGHPARSLQLGSHDPAGRVGSHLDVQWSDARGVGEMQSAESWKEAS